MNVLIVAPHADDEVLGCGGLIAKRARIGAYVHVAVIGMGGVHHRGGAEEATIDTRRRELERAANVLGVSDITVLYPGMDMRMDTVPMIEVVTALDGLLDAADYDEIYLPYASVNHDHQVAYRAMLAALRPAAGRRMPRFVAAYEYAMIGWQLEAVPGGRLYVDIADEMDTKLCALEEYASQLRPFPHPCSVESVTALATYRGMEAGLRAAELFYLLREIER